MARTYFKDLDLGENNKVFHINNIQTTNTQIAQIVFDNNSYVMWSHADSNRYYLNELAQQANDYLQDLAIRLKLAKKSILGRA